MELLTNILNIENAISREIQAFMKLQIFPMQELNSIRKEIKMFKEQQEEILLKLQSNNAVEDSQASNKKSNDSKSKKNQASSSAINLQSLTNGYDNLMTILLEENKLCDKKLMLLNIRREAEEEARLAYMKKMAKLKAAEDNQSKDPSNFKNQGGRF